MLYPELISEYSSKWREWGFYDHQPAVDGDFGLPEMIEVEPIHFCNFNCIMCHVHFEPVMSRTKLDLELVADRLSLPGLRNKWLMIASGYEGTAHPGFSKFVNRMSDHGMKLEMTTNGSLLTNKLISEISDCNFKYITFSFDGMTRETYEFIRQGANFDVSRERIGEFRQAFAGRDTYFNVNYTTMKRNIGEIPEAARYWNDLDLDQIFFIAMRVRPGGGKHDDESLDDLRGEIDDYMARAVTDVIEDKRRITLASAFILRSGLSARYPDNILHHIAKSDHPGARPLVNPRAYYQNGDYPGMSVPCRSPFRFARIDYNGDVFLCQRYKVGNIAEREFIDIWHGKEAQRIRQMILETGRPCAKCDHFRLCVKADELDPWEPQSLRQTIPQLIGEFKDFTIFRENDLFYGVPASVIHQNEPLSKDTTFCGVTVDEVMLAISKHLVSG